MRNLVLCLGSVAFGFGGDCPTSLPSYKDVMPVLQKNCQ